MDFEILAESTTPLLDLDTLRLRDPVCRPAYKSPLNDRVLFHVPLNGCGTRHWVSVWPGLVGFRFGSALTNAVIHLQFDGEQIHYENEVRALWTDLPVGTISRDSELRCVWKPLWVIQYCITHTSVCGLPAPSLLQVNSHVLLQQWGCLPHYTSRQPFSSSFFSESRFPLLSSSKLPR